jgi:hypothetical protein
LSRYAAAVFHSVQVVEVGLIALGEFIGVNDPHSGWTAVSTALDKVIAKKHQDRTALERDNFVFLEQVQGIPRAPSASTTFGPNLSSSGSRRSLVSMSRNVTPPSTPMPACLGHHHTKLLMEAEEQGGSIEATTEQFERALFLEARYVRK